MNLNVEQRNAIVELLAAGSKLTGMSAARILKVDWHECSDYLAILHAKGIARVAGFDHSGMTIYELAREAA